MSRPSPLPRQHSAKRKHRAQGDHERREGRIEKRRPDRQRPLEHEVRHQRPDRTDEHHERRHRQQQVVDHQRRLPAYDSEHAPRLHGRCAQGVEQKRPAGEHAQDHQDEDPPLRVVRKRMHARQHAGAYDEGPDQREPERKDRQ